MGKSLRDIFGLCSIKMDLNSKTKELALAELIESIMVLHPECDRNEMLTAIIEREKKLSTGIGNGIAIPHANCRSIASMHGAIGMSKQGIDFEALDNEPVHIIFLLTINEKANENHLHVLNQIFNLVRSEYLALIKNAKNAEEIHAILSQVHL